MKHPLNGKRASAWNQKHSLCVIACIPTVAPPFPPLSESEPPVRALVQVMLRPEKMTEMGYLRLGETPGDEANCWISPSHVLIVEVLGRAEEKNGTWEVSDALEREELRAAA